MQHKFIAGLLAAAMLFTPAMQVFAEETDSAAASAGDLSTEPPTEDPTEPATDLPTEPQSEDPTEPASEPPTDPAPAIELLPPVVYCQEYYDKEGDFALRIKCLLIDGAQGYHYEISKEPEFKKPLYSFDRAENDVFLKIGIQQDTIYYVRVRAYTETGEATYDSPYAVTQFCAPSSAAGPLQAPELNGFTLDAIDKLLFRWNPVEGASAYEIDIAQDEAFTDPFRKSIGGAYGGYQYQNMQKGIIYWMRIRSVQETTAGNQYSAYRTATVCIPEDFSILLGDVNSSKEVNASDAAKVLIAAAQIGAGRSSGLTTMQTISADVNGDRTVNASDAAVILVYAAAIGAGRTDVSIKDFVK